MLVNNPIIMFHSLYVTEPHPGGIPVDKFREYLLILRKQGFWGCSIEENRKDPSPTNVCLTFDDGYINNLYLGVPLLEEFGFTATFFVLAEPEVGFLPWHSNDPQPLMGPEEWRSLMEAGHEVASHGLTHQSLPFLEDWQAEDELKKSKNKLEGVLGKRVLGYAYPKGKFQRKHEKMVAKHYDYACATRYRFPWFENRFRLRRIGINDMDGIFRFKKKMSFPVRMAFDLGF